jgi:S-adenosylmethionine synthetase
VDRSGAYVARWLAVDYLNSHPEENEALVKIAYSIGVAQPVMVSINDKEFEYNIDLTPK